MQMLVAARHRPGTSHITGSIARPDLPDWCTLVPYAGPGDTQELEREREVTTWTGWQWPGLSVRSELGGVTTPGQCYITASPGTHTDRSLDTVDTEQLTRL